MPGEPGMVPVDHPDQFRLPAPRARVQAGHRHPVTDPGARVLSEREVGQRVDNEVMPVEQCEDHAPADRQFGRGQPRDQDAGERLGVESLQVGAHLGPEFVAQRRAGQHRGDRLRARGLIFEGILQQFGHVQDFDALVAEHLGQDVVLLLGPADPRQGVEQQPVGTTRSDPSQFQAGTVHEHRPEPADLAVDAVRVPPRLAHFPPADRAAPPRAPVRGVSPVSELITHSVRA